MVLACLVVAACAGDNVATAPATTTTVLVTTTSTAAPTTATAATTTAAPATTTTAAATTTTATSIANPSTTALAAAAPAYAIGTRILTLVDTSRPTRANGSAPALPDRTLDTLLLYPAVGTPSLSPVADAEAAEAPYGFPLLVFGHGLGGNTSSLGAILPRLAAAGYIVAAPEFPLSKRTAAGGPTPSDYTEQPADMSFVISAVLSGAAGPLPTVDGGRVAIAGHSLGAITTIGLAGNSCCRDARVRAAIAISGFQGQFAGPPWYQAPVTPLLLIHGDNDPTVSYQGSTDIFATAPSPVFLVTLLGAGHWVFGDPYLDVVATTMLDFLRVELDDDPAALTQLATDGQRPGVSTFQQR